MPIHFACKPLCDINNFKIRTIGILDFADKLHRYPRTEIIIHIPTVSMKIVHFFSVILTVADIVSDLVLAVDYCVTDNPLWCGLTWALIPLDLYNID